MIPDRKQLADFFHDRTSWERVGGYLLVAWAVVEVVDTFASLIGLPLWFGKAVLALLGAGLLVVILTAVFESGVVPDGSGASPRGRLRRLFTWRRAVAGGLTAFTLLGMGTAGYLTARSLGMGPVGTLLARGVLTEDAELVLADFEDHTGDLELTEALTQAFRVHLSQSPTVRLASTTRVGRALELMEARGDDPLDRGRAREVAIREGLKAVIGGEVHRVGSRYTVSVVVVAAESGEELVTALEAADDPGELIGAVERLSIRVRERIGESLASVRRSPPLSRVRTTSLAALKSFTEAAEANGRGDFGRCALLNEEAIALDSMFAMAYVGRAACNQNLRRNRALQVADRIRAYGMRDRMTERERLQFTAIYHQYVTEDRPRAIEAWEAYISRYPDSPAAHFALANLYAESRDPDRAETMLRRGLELDPERTVVLINLAGYQTNQGRFAEAHATLDRVREELPGLDIGWWRATTYLAEGAWDSARTELAAARARARGNPAQRSRIAVLEAVLALTRGRVDDADRAFSEAIAVDTALGAIDSYHRQTLLLADLHLHVRGDTAAALRILDGALAQHPLESLDPFERQYFAFAGAFAETGRLDRARSLIAAWERELAPLLPGSAVPAWLRAAIAEAEGRYEDALTEWRLEDEVREDPAAILLRVARLHDRLGRPDSAFAYYRRYLTTPARQRYVTDQLWRGPALERLGDLLMEHGAVVEAVGYYRQLIDLWDDADPALQPRVERVRARLASLAAET